MLGDDALKVADFGLSVVRCGLWRGRHRSDSSGGSAMELRKRVDGQVFTVGAFCLSLVKGKEDGWGGGARSRCRRRLLCCGRQLTPTDVRAGRCTPEWREDDCRRRRKGRNLREQD